MKTEQIKEPLQTSEGRIYLYEAEQDIGRLIAGHKYRTQPIFNETINRFKPYIMGFKFGYLFNLTSRTEGDKTKLQRFLGHCDSIIKIRSSYYFKDYFNMNKN